MKKAIAIFGGVLLFVGAGISCVVFANNTDIKSQNSNLDAVTEVQSTKETVDSEEITKDVSNSEVKVRDFGNVTVEYSVSTVSESVVKEEVINDNSIGQGGQEAIDSNR